MGVYFRINRWLEKDDFQELLKISDYVGRDRGRTIFIFNPSKAVKNGFDTESIIDLLMSYGAEINEKDLEEIKSLVEKELERKSIKIEILYKDGEIIIKPENFLGEVLNDVRDVLHYDRNEKIFKTYPIYYRKIISHFNRYNVKIIDKTGFIERSLPIKPVLNIQLRDYQKEALNKWIENSYRGIIALPTGSGKTIVGVAAVAELSKWTLIVAFTREQVKQWKEQLIRGLKLSQSEVGVFHGEEKRIAPITVSTYQTAFRYIETLSPYFSFIIIDECHHLPADKFRKIALHSFAYYRLGLSATPYREDGRHEELFPMLGGIVYTKSAKELAEEGYLAPFMIKVVKVDLTPEEMKIYKDLKDKYSKLSRGYTFEELVSRAKKGDEEAAEALRIRTQMRMLVHMAKEKIEALKKIFYEELKKGSKILIFTQYIDQAEEIGKLLGIPVITGETDPSTRKKNFELFRSGYYKALVVTSVGDEGIDIPDANVGILVAGTGSRRQFIQRLGRLLRPKEREAVLYEIIVRNTFEEAESRRRRSALKDLES